VDSGTATLNYNFAMIEQLYLRRCDYCQRKGEKWDFFGAHQSADLLPLPELKGHVGGADLENGAPPHVAPLMRCR